MGHVRRRISVIGLGYVGLPVAVAFSEAGFNVIGFDINQDRIQSLRAGKDSTNEVETHRLNNPVLVFSDEPAELKSADFHIITVPTPVNAHLEPDISYLLNASELVGKSINAGDVVVYESTVYPGCTEEDCIPILERWSGLKAGQDFHVGYSPERINPGDHTHRFETILKVVSGQTKDALSLISQTYGEVVEAGIYEAESIKVAEAAKVIENTQRDLNIAFVNELSKIFKLMNIDTHDVLKAANTKWNFSLFEPGLVGGHCIGVDPYYLTSKAERLGASPEIILAGRQTNNEYSLFIKDQCALWLKQQKISSPRIAVLGVTFKENVPDIRNSLAFDLIEHLKTLTSHLNIYDPIADMGQKRDARILTDVNKTHQFDVVVLAVPHTEFLSDDWGFLEMLFPEDGPVLVMDIKAKLNRNSKPDKVDLWRP